MADLEGDLLVLKAASGLFMKIQPKGRIAIPTLGLYYVMKVQKETRLLEKRSSLSGLSPLVII